MLDLGTLVGKLSMDAADWIKGTSDADGALAGFAGSAPKWMAIATGAIIAGAAVVGGALFAVGSSVDDMGDSIRVGTGESGVALDGLLDSAKTVAAQVPGYFDSVGPTVADLNTRLGLTGDSLETVATQFIQAGHLLGETVDIDSATGAMSAFGTANEDVSGRMDFLFQVSQATGIGMNDLTGRLSSAAPIVQQLGFSFEDTAALIGTMDKAGLDSQTMIGAMQRGLVNLSQPGESAQDAFRRVTGEIQGFIDKGDHAAAIDLAGQVFGTRGAAQFIGALQSGNLNMQDLIGSAGLSGDTILGVAEDTEDFGERWDRFVNQMILAFEPIGTRVFNAVSEAMDVVGTAAGPAFAWISENSALLEAFGIIVGSFAAAFLIVNGAIAAYNAVMAIYQAVTTAGSVAQWLLNVAMTANPIGIIIVAVGALIAAIVLLIMNWDTVIKFLGDAWNGFVGWFTGVMEGFAGWLGEVWTNIVAGVTLIWNGLIDWLIGIMVGWYGMWSDIWNNVSTFVANTWNGIVSFITGVWEGWVNWIRAGLLAYVAFWQGVWSGVSDFIAGVWQNITTGVTIAWNGITSFLAGVPGAILGFFADAGRWLMDTGRNIIDGLLEGLRGAVGAVWDFISGIGQGIADTFAGILGIASPSRVFAGFGMNIGEGLIEGLERVQPQVDARLEGLAADAAQLGVGGGTDNSSHDDNRAYAQIMVGSPSEAADVFEALNKGRPGR